MSDEAIAAVSSSTPAEVAAAYQASQPPSAAPLTPSQEGLLEAQVTARESLEQLAQHGDALAIALLAQAHPHPAHAPGAAEPGKGRLIDEYD